MTDEFDGQVGTSDAGHAGQLLAALLFDAGGELRISEVAANWVTAAELGAGRVGWTVHQDRDQIVLRLSRPEHN